MHAFASHFNDENHYTVLMAIASLTPLKGAPPRTYPSSHQQKKMDKNMQKRTTKPSVTSSKPKHISTGREEEDSGEITTESTYARVGRCK